MATFYVLPPREALESAVSSLFAKLLPGLPLPADSWGTLSEHLSRTAGWPDDVFLVPRDELLPGLPLPADSWGTLSEHLARAAGWPDDVFLVPRDELPDGDTADALAEGYGADAADRVVEVSLARGPRGVSLAGR